MDASIAQFSAGFHGSDRTDFEWRVIKPLFPNKSRGVRRVDDRRVLNGMRNYRHSAGLGDLLWLNHQFARWACAHVSSEAAAATDNVTNRWEVFITVGELAIVDALRRI